MSPEQPVLCIPVVHVSEPITRYCVSQGARRSTTALVLPAATAKTKRELRCSPAAGGLPILPTTGLSLLPRHWLRYGIVTRCFATFHPVVVVVVVAVVVE